MSDRIERAARVIAEHVGFLDDMDSDPQVVEHVTLHPVALARALDQAGVLAPGSLREEWAAIDDDGNVRMRYGADSHSPHREYGTSWTYSRWVSDWMPADPAEDARWSDSNDRLVHRWGTAWKESHEI